MRAAGYRKVRLNQNPVKLLKRAGQPQARPTRSYRYCVRGRENKRAGLAAVFTAGKKPKSALVVTDARTVRIGDVRPHARAFAVSRSARKLGHGLYSRRAGKSSNRYVFGVKGGKVAFVGVASRGAAKNGKSLRRYLKLGGFR
jgi:hypothetical protein